MNWVDLIIIVAAISSAINGFYRGGARQLMSYGGFWLGLFLGAALAPSVAGAFSGFLARIVVTLVVIFGSASLLSTVGTIAGTRIWGNLRRMRLGGVDAAVGSGVSVVAVLLAAWFLGHMFSRVPIGPISSSIHQSKVIQTTSKVLPPAPSVIAEARQLFASAGFPDVFAELEPAPAEDAPLPGNPQVQAAVAAARSSTVRIVGSGCGGVQTGSGFVAAPGLIVTNAHVVAGIDEPFVEDANGRHASTPVHFDPNMDIAILRTSGLAGDALPMRGATVDRGHSGAALGYPGGGSFTASAAVVLSAFEAVGRDIYGRDLSERPVYQMRAEIHPGNSGGPFVDAQGQVTGVMFSASARRSDVSYAIQSPEVASMVREHSGNRQRTDTGPCTR
ncbi:MAG: MarP family serine protease [Actinobacteria bacterium]|nr:MarP family serine protease [Actinomycetota bacterium]